MPFIEPTVAEVKRDRTWGELLEDVERRVADAPPGDFRLRLSRDFTDVVALLEHEGRLRDLPTVSRRRLTQAYYVAYRLDGQPHTIADICAHRTPPMSNTDREFLEGHCNGNQFEGMPMVGNWYKRRAEAAGVDVKGKVYVNALAAFPGDPKAWVAGRGDLEAVVRERDWSCQGSSNIKSEGRFRGEPDVRVADDLVESRMVERVESDPSLALKGREALFEETREQIQPHWTA